MDVTLTPGLERLIHDKVASGLYTSEDEAIREALRLLKDRDELRVLAVEDLRREGVARLRNGTLSLAAPLLFLDRDLGGAA
jgi:antitoxin ParD1/3/4